MGSLLKVIATAMVITFPAFGCFAAAEPTPIPTATPDVGAMVRAAIATALDRTELPAPTPAATPTPRPTHTPFPSPTRNQAANAPVYVNLVATLTPAPTPTVRPYQQPTQTTNHWSETGNWYRDHEYENRVNAELKAQGYDQDASFASLDSVPDAWASQLHLTFGCVSGTKVAYFFPYSYLVPPEVDTYVIGIWDESADAWKDGDVHFYYDPILVDDGSGIFVANQAQVRQMFSIIQKAARQPNRNQALNAGMFADNDENIQFWGEFDVAGIQDVVEYLPCF